MRTIFTETGNIEKAELREIGSELKGLERVFEDSISVAKGAIQTVVRARVSGVLAELKLEPVASPEIEKAIEEFIDDQFRYGCSWQGWFVPCYGMEEEVSEFIKDKILENIFKVTLQEIPECEDCDGRGWYERGLRGTRTHCDTCNGAGTVIPKEEEVPQ